ncbi:MAG: hypothetical protein KKH12_03275 [Gammaproteobacteria bacterium]|nr:hypothetical protein [Gammaproteobacteria bacterium]MBU1480677.1 hypothetical protein [Gammaproteobacteria bacterium]
MTKGKESPFPAKLTAPKVGKAAPRTQLFRLLDEMRNKPVIWIGAPAGSGKTTLVSSYLLARKIKPLWYQFDLRDADPATFFSFLRQAVGKLASRKRETLPLLTPEYGLSLPVFALNFFEQMFARLHSPALLVFDNFQDLPESSTLYGLLEQLVSVLPEGANVIFISRSDAPSGFARLRVARQMSSIGAAEMALSAEEARQVGECVVPGGMPAAQIDDLNARAGGWVAGLILLLEGAGSALQDKDIDVNLFDYFAAEVMRRADAETQEFLSCSALLPVMDVRSAKALTGNDRAGAILQSLVRRNYFIGQRQGDDLNYEFHPLFRAYLLDELRRRCDPEALRKLQRRAGAILAESSDYAAAVELLRDAGAFEELAALVLTHAEKLIAEGRFLTLKQWLEAIPEEVQRAQPWLLYWKAAALMPIDFAASHALFAKAFDVFLSQKDRIGMALAWSGAVETVVHSLSHTERLDEWIEKMDLLRTHAGLDDDQELQAHIAPQVIAIYALRGKMDPQLEYWLALTQALLTQPIDATQRIMASFALVAFFHWSGQPSRSEPILKLQARILEENDVTPLATIITKLCGAWFSWIYGRFDLCLQAIEEGLAIVERTGVQHWTFILVVQGITSALVRNDMQEAEQYFSRLESLHPYARDMDRAYYHNEIGWLELLKGRTEFALNQQKLAVEIAESVGAPFVVAETSFGLSQAHYALGDLESARRYLDAARTKGEIYGSQTLAFQCALIDAYYHLDGGDERGAADILIVAFGRAKRLGHSAFAWWRQDVIARICQFALDRGIEPVFIRNLVRQFHVVPSDTTTCGDSWPWPLKIYTLGRFAVVKDDDSVIQSVKTQKKTLDLLKALIAFGGRDVSDQKLSEALWPQAEGDLAHQSFKVTLHRLRKLIGADALVIQDGKLSLDARHAWVDAWAFERLLGALENASTEEDIAARVGQAIKLYGGAFLQSDEEAWALSLRERLRSKFLRIIGQATDCLCTQSHCAEALACYQKGLEIDPLAESFYQGQMQCHYCLKQPAAGLAVYQRCREALERELGVFPSSKTEELHTRLRQLSA